MKRDRAAYMRAYRAKDRSTPRPSVEGPDLGDDLKTCREENERLKRELAKRPAQAISTEAERIRDAIRRNRPIERRNPYREFRPVPK